MKLATGKKNNPKKHTGMKMPTKGSASSKAQVYAVVVIRCDTHTIVKADRRVIIGIFHLKDQFILRRHTEMLHKAVGRK
jgi:hypothetical protein